MAMKVADMMTRGVISLAPEDSARKAAELMLRYDMSGFRCSTAASSSA
jgi:predicted transcriptional regulator